jgi:peptide deformylase
MIETMKEYDGVGLAAPQVHIGLRMAVLEVPKSDRRGDDGVPLTVLLNPELTAVGDEKVDGWEGCLSIPELRGVVPRAARVHLKALDRTGTPFEIEAGGFFARVLQHECDHLDGRVYLDRMPDLKSLGYLHEMEKHGPLDDDEEDGEEG